MSQSVVQSALSGPQYDAWLGYHSELPRANEFTKKTAPAWSKLILAEENHGVITTGSDRTFTGTGEVIWRETVGQSSV